MASNDAREVRTRYYQPFSKGPWVVFFRTKVKAVRTLDISRDLLRKYPEVKVHQLRPDKVRVEAPNYNIANEIADHELFNVEYRVYIPSRDVEIEGVVTDPSLTTSDLKRGSGSFKNSKIQELAKILDAKQLHTVSMQDGKKVYKLSDSYRVTFAGSVLPNFVKLDGAYFPVRLFVPRVYNCTNCKQLGHSATYCGNKPRCGKCGGKHQEDSCTEETAKCTYCGENPHDLQECPAYKQHTIKVKRSITGRSKRTFADMLKAASAGQDENQFSILSAEESDSDASDVADSSVVHAPSNKRKQNASPKVRRKVTKVTTRRLQNSQSNGDKIRKPKTPVAPNPGCSRDFPPLPTRENKKANPQASQVKSKSTQGLIAFSDIVDFIFQMFHVQDPIRSIITAMLPAVEAYLKQLTVSWPLLAAIVSFDG